MSSPVPTDEKLVPIYSLAQVARVVGCKPQTLTSWVRGRSYSYKGEKRRSQPVFGSSSGPRSALSFLDLVEAHMVHRIRKGYGIPIKNFRKAMDYLRSVQGDLHFLAHENFVHDKTHLYSKSDDYLVSLSERGQTVDAEIIKDGLKQLMYGEDGYANRFFPQIGGRIQNAIMLNPNIGYGQPALVNLGVNIHAIVARFDAGEHLQDLAADYGATSEELEDALRCNHVLSRA